MSRGIMTSLAVRNTYTDLPPGIGINPLRNMVLLELAPQGLASALQVVQAERSIQRFTVLACGPEVQDIQLQQTVLANRLAATLVGGHYLLPETAILATVS